MLDYTTERAVYSDDVVQHYFQHKMCIEFYNNWTKILV